MSRLSSGLYIAPLLLFLLGGCALVETKSNNSFHMARGLQMPFLPLSGIDTAVDLTHQVTLTSLEGRERFLVRLQINPEELTMVGLSLLGQKLFQIQYSGGRARFEKTPFAPPWLEPKQLLGDYQMIYWHPDSINRPLTGSTVRLEQSQRPVPRRIIRHDDTPLLQIGYHDEMDFHSTVDFHHMVENRRMTIVPLKTP